MYGGRGSSKSWSAAAALLIHACLRRERVLCCREFQNTIKDSVHRLLKDHITRLKLNHCFHVTGNSIVQTENHSEFIFSGLYANVAQIKSLEGITKVWVEEAETVSAESWRNLIPTIRLPGSEIWLTFNPRDEEDPTSQMFIKNDQPDCWKVKVNWNSVNGESWSNPFFSQVLREQMEHDYKVDPGLADHVWGGEFKINSNAQIFAGKCFLEPFEAKSDWLGPFYGMDFGFSADPFSCHKYWVGSGGDANTVFVEHEAWGHRVELNDIPALLTSSIPGVQRHLVIKADNSRPESISHLCNMGWKVVAARKWPGCVNDGIAYLRSLDRIVIHPRCKEAWREARLYSYKIDRLTGNVLTIIVDAYNHFWDDCRYAMEDAILTPETERVFTSSQLANVQRRMDIDRPDFMRI